MKKELKNVAVSYSKKTELDYFNNDMKRHLSNASSIISKIGITGIIEINGNNIDVNEKNLLKLEQEKNKLKDNEKRLLSHCITSIKNVIGLNSYNAEKIADVFKI